MTYSLYLHIPFCAHRCGYCDFNTYAGLGDLIPSYADALVQEIEQAGQGAAGQPATARQQAHTVFFGGGTPSLLPTPQLERILAALRSSFELDPQAEITLEANPGTLSLEYLHTLRVLGVNRLSLGVQSANPSELRLLERQHDFLDVIRSVTWARRAGFDNLSLDLIFGLPEQTLAAWQRTLALALDLQPEHLSLYALTMEHGTPFGRWARRGLLSLPDPDTAAEMYEWASERLESKGYAQYEISNWARADRSSSFENPSDTTSPTLACRHNLQYWRNLPYLGLGAGAHGYAAGRRTINTLSPQAYIQRLAALASPVTTARGPGPVGEEDPGAGSTHRTFPLTAATQSSQAIDRAAEIGETMMMGLRLVREGVSDRVFQERFGQSLGEVFPRQIERLVRQGLLEWAGAQENHLRSQEDHLRSQENHLRLSRRAHLLANRVFVEFI